MQTSRLCVLYKLSYCRWKFHIAGIGISDIFIAPVILTLTRWPSYTKVIPYSLEIYRTCENELPMSRLSKVIVWQTDRQTDRQTDALEIIYHTASWVASERLWDWVVLYDTDPEGYRTERHPQRHSCDILSPENMFGGNYITSFCNWNERDESVAYPDHLPDCQ